MPHCDKYSLVLSTLVLSKKILSALSVLQLSWTTVRAVHRRSLRHDWDMSHVVSRTSNLISQYLQAPEGSSIFKLIILQHNLGRSNLPLNGNWRVTLSDPPCSKQSPRCQCHQARSQRSVCKHVIVWHIFEGSLECCSIGHRTIVSVVVASKVSV